jgi:hypothetical protein
MAPRNSSTSHSYLPQNIDTLRGMMISCSVHIRMNHGLSSYFRNNAYWLGVVVYRDQGFFSTGELSGPLSGGDPGPPNLESFNKGEQRHFRNRVGQAILSTAITVHKCVA